MFCLKAEHDKETNHLNFVAWCTELICVQGQCVTQLVCLVCKHCKCALLNA